MYSCINPHSDSLTQPPPPSAQTCKCPSPNPNPSKGGRRSRSNSLSMGDGSSSKATSLIESVFSLPAPAALDGGEGAAAAFSGPVPSLLTVEGERAILGIS